MDNSIYLEQLEQKINSLISVKKYREAYDLCKQLLLRFPQETDLLKIKSRIEKEAGAENERVVKEKIESLKPLWKSENYTEILKNLKELFKLAPNNEKLKSLYLETENKYQKQIDSFQAKFLETQNARLEAMLEENPSILLDTLFDLEKENAGSKIVLELTQKFRNKLISKKIDEKEDLIYSDKFQDIENFIAQLKKMDEKNAQTLTLEKFIHGRQHQTQITQKDEFVYAGEKHLDTLMKLKKYDKVIKVAEELLAAKSQNSEVKKILKTATNKYLKQLHSLTAEKIEKEENALKTEFQQNPSGFINL